MKRALLLLGLLLSLAGCRQDTVYGVWVVPEEDGRGEVYKISEVVKENRSDLFVFISTDIVVDRSMYFNLKDKRTLRYTQQLQAIFIEPRLLRVVNDCLIQWDVIEDIIVVRKDDGRVFRGRRK